MQVPPVPVLHNTGQWYDNNFYKSEHGNTLNREYPWLWVQIKDIRSFVAGTLQAPNGNYIQAEQSYHVRNPWWDVIRFELTEMKDGKVVPMQPGEYTINIKGDRGTSDTQGVTDKFMLI